MYYLFKHTPITLFLLTVLNSPIAYSTINEVYLGGKLSWSHANSACEPQSLRCENEMIGRGVYAGIQWNSWLETEFAYLDFGAVNAIYPALMDESIEAPYRSQIKGLEASLRPFYPISDRLTVFGKIGAIAWRNEVTGQEINYNYKQSEKGWDILFGLSTEYALNDQWLLRAELQQFPVIGGDVTGRSSISMVSAGITYRFNKKPVVGSPSVTIRQSIASNTIPSTTTLSGKHNRKSLDKIVSRTLLFKFDSYELSEATIKTLNSIVTDLKQHTHIGVLATGHTDGMGTNSYNHFLSHQRAKAVKNYLIEQGIEPHRVQVNGLGSTDQVASNKTAQGRVQNRRVVLTTRLTKNKEK